MQIWKLIPWTQSCLFSSCNFPLLSWRILVWPAKFLFAKEDPSVMTWPRWQFACHPLGTTASVFFNELRPEKSAADLLLLFFHVSAWLLFFDIHMRKQFHMWVLLRNLIIQLLTESRKVIGFENKAKCTALCMVLEPLSSTWLQICSSRSNWNYMLWHVYNELQIHAAATAQTPFCSTRFCLLCFWYHAEHTSFASLWPKKTPRFSSYLLTFL